MISCILLAAGLSKRMTLGNKLLLEKDKQPIINLTLNNIVNSKVEEIIIVLGKQNKDISEAISKQFFLKEKQKIVYNNNYKYGLSSSIISGVKKIEKKDNGIMICLADMPMIKTSTYNKIINSFTMKKRKIICVPYYKNVRGNPLIFSHHFRENLLELKGDYGAKDILRKFNSSVNKINCIDEGILKDIDNLEDYRIYVNKK